MQEIDVGGVIYEFPDGMSDDAIRAAIMADMQPVAPPQEPQAPEGPGGFMRGLRDPLDAGAQMLEKVLPEGLVTGINRANDWLVDRGVPLERLGDAGLSGQLQRLDAAYNARRVAEGEDPASMDWARLGGNVAGGVGGAGAVRALTGPAMLPASAAGRVGLGVGGGAAGGALGEPVMDEENFWAEKAKQAGIGAATGGALGGVAEGIGKMGRQIDRPEVQQLRAAGVEPTVGQSIGGMADTLEQKAASIPFAGDMIAARRGEVLEQYNNAAINKALEPLGETVEGAGQDAIERAQDAVSRAYSSAAAATRGVPVDAQTRGALDAIRTQGTAHLDEETANNFGRFMENVIDAKLGNAPGLTQESFEEVDKLISAKVRSAKSFEAKQVFQGLRNILLDQAERANPQYADLYRKARTAAAGLMRVEEAATAAKASTKGDAGVFTPGQLIRGAAKMETGRKARKVAAGDAMMQELGTLGQRVLGDTVPNSGTADRAMAGAGVAGMINPAIGGSLAALSAAYSRPGQEIIRNILRGGAKAGSNLPVGYLSGLLGEEFGP